MSSINDAIHNKALLQSNVLLRILFRIFFKDFVCGGRVVDYFWPPAML